MKKADRIYYGGDYNPDQWDEATIAEDMRLFKKGRNQFVDIASLFMGKIRARRGRI